MAVADIVCLVLYLVLITGLGIYAARLVRRMSDYFMPRRFGKVMMITHAFGTGTHSDQAVSVASKTFTNGLSGIWYQWLWLFCTPFYWLIAPVMRRFRAITTGDVFAARYDRSVAGLFAVIGMLQLSVNIGVMLKGSGAVIEASTGIPAWIAIAAMTVMFVTYGVAGGLSAAIITDFVQGILTVVFSFLLLPFVLEAVGGMAGLHERIADAKMFSLVAPGDIGVFYIVMIAVNALVGIVTQPHTMGNCAAGKTEMEGRVGWMGGNFIKRICTMAWCLTGLAAVAYLAGRDVHPDEVYGVMAADFLPRILPGLLGVFLAALLASVMSSCDSFMIASSALFTENIYKPLLPGKADRHYLAVGRVVAMVVVAGGVLVAFRLPSVVRGLEWFWKISPTIGIAFWLGLFWRRTTTAGAWAATLVGFAVLLAVSYWTGLIEALEGTGVNLTLGLVRRTESGVAEMFLPWQMVAYLGAGTLAGVVVSLFTRPVPKEQLDHYYALARTPVVLGEEVEEPCTLPAGMQPAPRRVLLEWGGLEIPVPTRTSIIGFAVGWALVAAMIGGFYWLTQ
jgi:Na+/proline symporter